MKIPALGQKVPLAPGAQILPVLGTPSLTVISHTRVHGVERPGFGTPQPLTLPLIGGSLLTFLTPSIRTMGTSHSVHVKSTSLGCLLHN